MKLGLAVIDKDHEQLLALAGEVERLISAGSRMSEVWAKFHELVEYSLEHFQREERQMEACGYPGLDVHRCEHREVGEWLRHIENELEEAGPGASEMVLEQTIMFFRAWIARHLSTFDKAAVEFLLATRESEAAPVAGLR